jgi:hypothetical protein
MRMALDVQPLSPARQTVMILVMLALLGFSLGFAQLLVRAREARGPAPRLAIPRGAAAAPELNGSPWQTDEPLNQLPLNILGKPRIFTAFYYSSKASNDPKSWREELQAIYRRLIGEDLDPNAPITLAAAILAGRQARELQCFWNDENHSAFLLIRMTVVDGRALAICYSGSGLLTDADTIYFDSYCNSGVAMERPSPLTRKG